MTTERRPQREGARYCEATRKRCWPSQAAAKRAMRALSARLRVYRCEACAAWHMTKLSEGKR